jgi:hypothetical protein
MCGRGNYYYVFPAILFALFYAAALRFLPGPLVFPHLVFEDPHSNARSFFYAPRSEQIGIDQFVATVAEVVDLEAALHYRRSKAEIDFAKADAQLFCKSLCESPALSSGVLSRP